jgi:hypothetical protein
MVVTRSKSIPNLNGNGVNGDGQHKENGKVNGGHRDREVAAMNGNGNIVKQAKVNGDSINGTAVQPSTGSYEASPRTTTYEFLGPPGALGISLLVPIFTYFFAFGCDERGCTPTPVGEYFSNGLTVVQTWQFYADLWDGKATIAYLAWYAWCVVCWAILPGQWVEGTVLRNGEKLWYKINGGYFIKMVHYQQSLHID